MARLLEPITIFFCSAKEDEHFLRNLQNHLRQSERDGVLKMASDRDFVAGTVVEREFDKHFNEDDIVLLLISADFLALDINSSIQIKQVVDRHLHGDTHVIPLLIRPTPAWKTTSFGKLQALPQSQKSVTQWNNEDDALDDIGKNILAIVEQLRLLRLCEKAYKAISDETLISVYNEIQKSLERCGVDFPFQPLYHMRRTLERLDSVRRAQKKLEDRKTSFAIDAVNNRLPPYWQRRERIRILIEQATALIREEQSGMREPCVADVERNLQILANKWKNGRFEMAIIAPIKTGKSTLINAWLGDEFMPVEVVPETARIVRVQHEPEYQEGVLTNDDSGSEVKGTKAICKHLRELNQRARQGQENFTSDALMLRTPLIALKNKSLGVQRFEILDTPGPNEAATLDLRSQIERLLLDEVDVIIYLLDYTKLRSVDESEMLKKLGEMRLELLNSTRTFFVINKIDARNRNSPSLAEMTEYVAAHLRQTIPGIQITPERVLMVSAEEALLARLVLLGRIPEEDREGNQGPLYDFKSRVFGILSAKEVTWEECLELAPKLFKRSRMEELEQRILLTIWRDRAKIYQLALLEDLNRYLHLFGNCLHARLDGLRRQQQEMESEIDERDKRLRMILRGKQEKSKITDIFAAKNDTLVDEDFYVNMFERSIEKWQLEDKSRIIVATFQQLQSVEELLRQTKKICESLEEQSTVLDQEQLIN